MSGISFIFQFPLSVPLWFYFDRGYGREESNAGFLFAISFERVLVPTFVCLITVSTSDGCLSELMETKIFESAGTSQT